MATSVYRFKLRDNPSCACGAEEQTVDHLLFECPKLDKERLAFQREMLRKTGKWTFTKLKIMREHLKDRFLNHKGILKSTQTLLPKNIVRASDEDLETAVEAIVNQWPNDVDASPESFFNELKTWRRNFLDQKNLHLIPTDFISPLNSVRGSQISDDQTLPLEVRRPSLERGQVRQSTAAPITPYNPIDSKQQSMEHM
ncbi:hypothetical protein ANN_11951 [Periplaneta americana]|uniref:Uncharacterized protein n=1 Tax=Periplaneta americana TaxID=6978 RepID=A0ABQ8T876_PERAM|nr:hypothetical protein ANN_11951 [Periplaneta americana]